MNHNYSINFPSFHSVSQWQEERTQFRLWNNLNWKVQTGNINTNQILIRVSINIWISRKIMEKHSRLISYDTELCKNFVKTKLLCYITVRFLIHLSFLWFVALRKLMNFFMLQWYEWSLRADRPIIGYKWKDSLYS